MEKAFLIFRLPVFNRNLRTELKKSRKIYFYDNGIRNAVIGQFSPLELRTDIGALWENFLIAERQKNNAYQQKRCQSYFWRTHSQQEIDYVETVGKKIEAYEFKWHPKAKARFSKSFLDAYKPQKTDIITQSNIDDFLL